jgi:hypothetical protein
LRTGFIGTYPGLGNRSHGCLEPELQGLKALRIILVHELPVSRSHETRQLGVGRRFPDNRRTIITRAEGLQDNYLELNPAFQFDADSDPASQNYADPDPQHCPNPELVIADPDIQISFSKQTYLDYCFSFCIFLSKIQTSSML